MSGESFIVSSTESLTHKHHELLLALVDLFEVVDKLGELHMAVVCHKEGITRFAEEFDELTIVAWADVREARVCGADVSANGGVQQLAQRRLVRAHELA